MRELFLIAALCGLAMSNPAQASPMCGATTHEKFGETRAYFKDVLAGCEPAGQCYVVTHVPDDGRGYQYLQQMRVRRASRDAAMDLQFVSVDPMANPSEPFALSVGESAWTLSPALKLTDNSANEYRLTDQAMADAIIARIASAQRATWLYKSDKGAPHAARFGLRGAKAALNWINCMQAGQ